MTEPNVYSSGGADTTSLTLLEKARTADNAAWDRLVRLYGPLIVHWCRAKTVQNADAENIRQEVFTAAFKGLGTFERNPTPGSFRAWLKTITLNAIANAARLERPGQVGAGGSDVYEQLTQLPARDADDTPDPAVDNEVAIIYGRALELIATDFQERTWKAFRRVVIDSQRVCDVAVELGMSDTAVTHACKRVLARLREEFGAHLHR